MSNKAKFLIVNKQNPQQSTYMNSADKVAVFIIGQMIGAEHD